MIKNTFSDMKGLRDAFRLREALTQTDKRLVGNQEVVTSLGEKSVLKKPQMLPIITSNGRGFLRNATKTTQFVIDPNTVKPGDIIKYPSESGIVFAQVTTIDTSKTSDSCVAVKEIDAPKAKVYVRDNSESKVVELTGENVKRIVDIALSPLDWLILKTRIKILEEILAYIARKITLEHLTIVVLIILLIQLSFTFYVAIN